MQDYGESPLQIATTDTSPAVTERAASGSLNSAPISIPDTANAGDESSSPGHDPHVLRMFGERKTQVSSLEAEDEGEESRTPVSQDLGVHSVPHTVAKMAASQEASSQQDEVVRKRTRNLDPSGDGQATQRKLQEDQYGNTDARDRMKAASLVDTATQTTLLASSVTPSPTKDLATRKRRRGLSTSSNDCEKRRKCRDEEAENVERTRFQDALRMELKIGQPSNGSDMTAPQTPGRRRSTALENMRVTKSKCKPLPDKVCRRITMLCYQDQNSLRALRLVNRRFSSAAGFFLFCNLILTLAVDPTLRFYSLLRSPNVPNMVRLCSLNAVRDASLTASDLQKMSNYLFHSFQSLGSLRSITLDFRRMSMRSRVMGPSAIRDQQIWLAAHALLGLRSDLPTPVSFTLNCMDDQDLLYISNFVRINRLMRLRKHGTTRKHAFSDMRKLTILNWQPSTDRHQRTLQGGVRSGLAKTLTELAVLKRLEVRGPNLARENLDALRAGVGTPMYVRLPRDDLGFGYGVSDVLQHLELWKVTIDACCLCRLIKRCSNTLREVRLNVAVETGGWSVVFSTLLCCTNLVGFGTNQDGLWVIGDSGSIRTGYLERDHGIATRTPLDREAMVLALMDRRKLSLLLLHLQDNRQRLGLPALTSAVWKQYDSLAQARQAARDCQFLEET